MNKGEVFTCQCKGSIKQIAPDKVLHVCGNKYSPGTSYYDGKGVAIPHHRVQVNPQLTCGEIQYNWFVDWS